MAQNLKKPRKAASMLAAASLLKIPRQLIRVAKSHGCPAIENSGRVDCDALSAWLKEHPGIAELGSKAATLDALKARNLLLQNDRLRLDLEVRQCLQIPSELVEQITGERIRDCKRVLLSGPSALAPQVVGETVSQAEKLIREWIENALAKLQPLAARGAFQPKG
jgi:hypothetical protein